MKKPLMENFFVQWYGHPTEYTESENVFYIIFYVSFLAMQNKISLKKVVFLALSLEHLFFTKRSHILKAAAFSSLFA